MYPRSMTLRSLRAPALVLAALLFAPAAACAEGASAQIYDGSKYFDVNELSVPISNFGPIARDFNGTNIGLEWPRGSGQRLVHAGGLWLLANVFGETPAAMADFGSEDTPGQMDPGGTAPAPTRPTQPSHPSTTSPPH